MNWLFQLHTTLPVALAIGVLAIVAAVGPALGNLSVRGINVRDKRTRVLAPRLWELIDRSPFTGPIKVS